MNSQIMTGSRSMDAVSSSDPYAASSWCHTGSGRTKEFTHRWTIDDFETKTRTFKVGAKLSSNTFTLGGQPAAIKVYPNGTVGNKNHVSIFLENKGEEALHISEIDFTLMPSSPGASSLSWNAPSKELDPEDDWGFQRFVSTQKLKEKKLISDDGKLEIITKISRVQQSNNVSFDNPHDCEVRRDSLGPQLWTMFKQGYMTDYTLVCEGLSLPCHKFILGARSEFFRGLLDTGLSESNSNTFKVTDVDHDTLILLLEFLYTGTIQESPMDLGGQQVELLMNASDFYVVPALKSQCEEWLIKSIDTNNMVDRLIMGDTFSAERLRKIAKDMLIENSKKLDLIPDWKRKLATRTELTLEVLEELAKNAL